MNGAKADTLPSYREKVLGKKKTHQHYHATYSNLLHYTLELTISPYYKLRLDSYQVCNLSPEDILILVIEHLFSENKVETHCDF